MLSTSPSISSRMFLKPNVVLACFSSHSGGSSIKSGCSDSRPSELFLAVLSERIEFRLEDILDRGLVATTGLGFTNRSFFRPAPKSSVRFVGNSVISVDEETLLFWGFQCVPPSSSAKAIAACIGQWFRRSCCVWLKLA